ncbi:MAG: 2,3-bisphosphoglycerate-independent phosphoglycerate mutase [Sedimentisphaerales bacterium]
MTKEKIILKRKPFVLIIRDGWGYNPDPKDDACNTVKQANVPIDRMLMSDYPHCLIHTSGEDVGLPIGTMGNSEVGHQNIGAGRVVYQESVRISKSIREGDFFKKEEFAKLISYVKEHNGKLHLLGLCSDIGVHSLLEHLYGLLKLAKINNLTKVYLHAFTDGRDSPPDSGKGYLADIEKKMAEIGTGKIASIMGRFYGMDRDSRWDRVQKAYDCLTLAKGAKAKNAAEAMEQSYQNKISDEFIEPVCIVDENDEPLAKIEDGDGVMMFNFRGDRPREITRAFVDDDFAGFTRTVRPKTYYLCMTEYDATIPAPVAFTKTGKMKNIAADYFSQLGLKQFRCAETEKYAHVTFFFNDYTEKPFPGEDRQIVPSPKVRTYDLKPQMSAFEVCDVVMEKLNSEKYDVIIVNFANPDMVGHTGIMEAAIKAAETVDACVGKILALVKQLGGAAIITADHGNFEKMCDENGNPYTSHTIGDVPLIVFDELNKNIKLRPGGKLADVMPTMLKLMELPKPQEMTGEPLF